MTKHMEFNVDEYEEQNEASVREQLGLRPIAYSADTDGEPGSHPDQRPCPSWCWIAHSDEYDHEIDPRTPFVALHTYDVRLGVASSRYEGSKMGNLITPATIEAHLEQHGQGQPTIKLALRHWPNGEMKYEHRLSLGVTDAQELATLLQHLVSLADSD